MTTEDRTSTPAHRPSRRNDILDAAIRLFARKGYVDAAISDVAAEADVVVTAVYYHFSGKDELYSAAVESVFESISAVVKTARPDESNGDAAGLIGVIDAVWDWIDDHPDEATLLYLQLPGATRQVARLRHEFEEQHVERAFGYFDSTQKPKLSAARRASQALTARTLVDVLISVHTMRLLDGPLSTHDPEQLRRAAHRLAERLVAT